MFFHKNYSLVCLLIGILWACSSEKKAEKSDSQYAFLLKTWKIQQVELNGKVIFEEGKIDPQSPYSTVKTTFFANGSFENFQLNEKKVGTWQINGTTLYMADDQGKTDKSEMGGLDGEKLVLSQQFVDWLGNQHRSKITMIPHQ